MIERGLVGRPLRRDTPMPFGCHPGLPCFNSCCRDKRLTLLPYDVLRLASGLGCGTDAFLARHAELEIERSSGWPTLRIRLAADGRCPFVRPEGCGVYGDRPTCCRIYPLARAVRLGEDGAPAETFLVDASCPGFGAAEGGTVGDWTRGQGLEAYQAANDRAARLFLHPDRPRPLSLSPAGVHLVVMALYNADVFRELVARPGFAERSGLPAEHVARAVTSPEALLELGQDWLALRLFGEHTPASGERG